MESFAQNDVATTKVTKKSQKLANFLIGLLISLIKTAHECELIVLM